MTAGTIEVVPVSDLEELLDTPLPCHTVFFFGPCPVPAEFRLSAWCACGSRGTVFLCPADLARARSGGLHCIDCDRADWEWALR